MKKLLPLLFLATVALAACGAQNFDVSGQTWEEFPPEGNGDTIRPVVKMNSLLDPNLNFKVKYHPDFWEIKETKGKYRTVIIFNHTGYKNETCYVLPGTIGYKLDKEYSVTEWSYKSDKTWGIDYQFDNPITGVPEMRVFEAESNGVGFPTTLFELHLPTDGTDQAQCRYDYDQLIATYEFDFYGGTPKELEAKLSEINAAEEANEKLEETAVLEEETN